MIWGPFGNLLDAFWVAFWDCFGRRLGFERRVLGILFGVSIFCTVNIRSVFSFG